MGSKPNFRQPVTSNIAPVIFFGLISLLVFLVFIYLNLLIIRSDKSIDVDKNSQSSESALTKTASVSGEAKTDIIKETSGSSATEIEYTPTIQPARSVRIPVLMYHHIAAVPKSSNRGLYVSPEEFEKQMAYLSSKGYKSLTPYEFLVLLQNGKNPEQKSALITFDDGNLNQYQNAFPILKKYGLTATFFVSTKRLGINNAQLREMAAAGMIIDSHGATHIDLKKEDDDNKLREEIIGSKQTLQYITSKTVFSIAYPGCVADKQALDLVVSSGYLLGFSCGKSIDHYYSQRFTLSRVHIYDDLENFKKRLVGIWEIPPGF